MHGSIVHPVPRRASVVREQMAAVGLSLRREAVVAGGIVALASVVVLWRSASRGFDPLYVTADMLAPGVLVALLAPLAVWKGEGPELRGYHHAMPVERGFHAVVRSAAGLVWVLAALAAYLSWILLLMGVTGGYALDAAWTEWAGPVAAALVLYFVGSAIALWATHPWRWIGGAAVAYVFLSDMEIPARHGGVPLGALTAVLDGRYGFVAVASGLTPEPVTASFTTRLGVVEHFTRYDYVAMPGSWLLAAWLWLAAAVTLFLWAAYRQPER